MRVLFDSRMIYASGIGRYIRSLLCELAEMDQDLEFGMLGNSMEFQRFLDDEAIKNRQLFSLINYPSPLYSISEQVLGGVKMRARGADLLHVPNFNAPWWGPDRFIITVHDLIPFKFPHMFNPFRLRAARCVMNHVVKQAAAIIVVSDATARDLSDMFPGTGVQHKIHRIYQGVSEYFQVIEPPEVERFKTQNKLGDYILYAGNRLPHKNLRRLALAFSNLRKDFPELQLVVAGKRFQEYDELDQITEQVSNDGIVEWGLADDAALRALYNGARVLVFPSLYEGFGLPPLEAMACGTPVIVSNTGSLPEVVGGSGICVDPYEVEDIARGIREVLTNLDVRDRMREAGLARARTFSWQETARQTMNIYREVVS